MAREQPADESTKMLFRRLKQHLDRRGKIIPDA